MRDYAAAFPGSTTMGHASVASGLVGAPANGLVLLRAWSTWAVASAALADNTLLQYRRILVALMADLMTDLPDVTEAMIVEWLSAAAGTWTRQLRVKALRSFYGWAYRRGHVDEDPTAELGIGRRPRSRPRGIAKPELAGILAAAASMEDPRVAPTLALLYYTGARVGSLAGARREDVDLEAGELWWDRAIEETTKAGPKAGPRRVSRQGDVLAATALDEVAGVGDDAHEAAVLVVEAGRHLRAVERVVLAARRPRRPRRLRLDQVLRQLGPPCH